MRLGDLLHNLPVQLVAGSLDAELTDLTDDSRHADPGCLFIAREGAKEDGQRYVTAACAAGAAAVLSTAQPPADLPGNVAWVTTPRVDQALCGELAERFFGYPSRKLQLIGVTGTNGKTTTTYLIRHLLNAAGMKTGLIGTIILDDGQRERPAELTTPGAIDLSRLLAQMVRHGCRAAVMETSSHALHQGRTSALDFRVAVFTNLTGDHLDYHGTMDRYADAKAILFQRLKPDAWAIVNGNDPYAAAMLADCPAHRFWCTMDEAHPGDDRTGVAQALSLDAAGTSARFTGPWGSVEVRLPLVGRHNLMNCVQAIAAANCVFPLSRALREALHNCPRVPGRLELVDIGRDDVPATVVDYAHTHDALENVLLALRPVSRGRVHVVFGCGGDRDRTKRPKMAAVACKLADRVYITSDNPRTEEPQAIINDILAGVPIEQRSKVTVEVDRTRAIRQALHAADPRDTVLIAGKGHEDYQIIGQQKFHYDDREVAGEILRRLPAPPASTAAS